MSFIWSPMLIGLVVIPLLVLAYMRMQLRRRQFAVRYSNFAVAQKIGIRRHIPPILFLIALTILIVALARPQAIVSVPRFEGTLILAFDISNSMAATDLEPTRMDAAKAAAEEFVRRQPPTILIGVVAFSDSGLAVQQPTRDQAAILAAIRRLSPGRGTSLGNGMFASLNTLFAPPEITNYYSNQTPEPTPEPTAVPPGVYTPAVIILLTDGENTEDPDPIEAAQMAVDRGVRIFTVGIGSAAGTVLNIEGFNVFTQLNEGMLQAISEMTGGAYFNAESVEDLIDIYSNLDAQLVVKPEAMEITPLFAGVSILIMLIGGMLSLVWFGRVV